MERLKQHSEHNTCFTLQNFQDTPLQSSHIFELKLPLAAIGDHYFGALC